MQNKRFTVFPLPWSLQFSMSDVTAIRSLKKTYSAHSEVSDTDDVYKRPPDIYGAIPSSFETFFVSL